MALPTSQDSLSDLLGDIVHTSAWTEAYPSTASLAPKLNGCHEDVVEKVQSRNRLGEQVIRAAVKREVSWRFLGESLVSLDRKVAAHFDEDRGAYKAFFPTTPRAIINTTISTREKMLEKVIEACSDKKLAKDLLPAAKKFLAAFAAYQAAVKGFGAAEKALAKGEEAVATAKTKAATSMRQVHGSLEAQFPEDRAFVESFFRKRSKATSKKKGSPGDDVDPRLPVDGTPLKGTTAGKTAKTAEGSPAVED